MKNLKKLLVLLMLVVCVGACSSDVEEETGVSAVCTQSILGMELQYIVEADSEEGDITSTKIVLEASYETLGFSDDSLLDDATKDDLLETMEASMGLDESIEVTSEFNEDGLYIEAVLPMEYLEDMSGEGSDLSYATFISDMESAGLTCE